MSGTSLLFRAVVALAVCLHTVSAFDGRATFFHAGLGACGGTNTDSDFIVALNNNLWANNAHCGDTLTISYNGQTAQATVADRCPTCPGVGDLDLTPALFRTFAPESEGTINMSWEWGSGAAEPAPQPSPDPIEIPEPEPEPEPETPWWEQQQEQEEQNTWTPEPEPEPEPSASWEEEEDWASAPPARSVPISSAVSSGSASVSASMASGRASGSASASMVSGMSLSASGFAIAARPTGGIRGEPSVAADGNVQNMHVLVLQLATMATLFPVEN